MDEFLVDPFDGEGILVSDKPDRRTWIKFDEDTGVWHKCEVQKIDPILEANRELYNNAGKRWGDMALVASIPDAIYWNGDFRKAREAQDEAWIKRFLNDSDNVKLRTRPGNI